MYDKHQILVEPAVKEMIARQLGCTVRNVCYYLKFEREGLNNEGRLARKMALEHGGIEINKPKE